MENVKHCLSKTFMFGNHSSARTDLWCLHSSPIIFLISLLFSSSPLWTSFDSFSQVHCTPSKGNKRRERKEMRRSEKKSRTGDNAAILQRFHWVHEMAPSRWHWLVVVLEIVYNSLARWRHMPDVCCERKWSSTVSSAGIRPSSTSSPWPAPSRRTQCPAGVLQTSITSTTSSAKKMSSSTTTAMSSGRFPSSPDTGRLPSRREGHNLEPSIIQHLSSFALYRSGLVYMSVPCPWDDEASSLSRVHPYSSTLEVWVRLVGGVLRFRLSSELYYFVLKSCASNENDREPKPFRAKYCLLLFSSQSVLELLIYVRSRPATYLWMRSTTSRPIEIRMFFFSILLECATYLASEFYMYIRDNRYLCRQIM